MTPDTLTPERWRQIEKLYHAALELRPEEREAFLDQACAGDEELRREVVSLIASHNQARTFISAPPADVIGAMIAERQSGSMIGRRLGRYRLDSLLGAGGMGEVYRARDTRLDRDVAVKILPSHLAGDPEALRRFEREAKAVAALSHPNILSIFDFGVEAGVSYAVTELLKGETLGERLKRSPLDWREAVAVGAAIASGLAAAHARGIIHRDLKPANVFLTADGGVKILDFGIARIKRIVSPEAETATSTLTATTAPGVVMGTIGYMSPEQVRGQNAEAPSDIFSLGCVIYEMLSRHCPFARDTAAETIAAILKEEPPPLRSITGEIPAELKRVIGKMLRKDCGQRYQTATEVVTELRGIEKEAGNGPAAAGYDDQAIKPKPRASVGKAAGVVLGAIILLAGGVAAYRFWLPSRDGASGHTPRQSHAVMRYYLEVETYSGPARVSGGEPLAAGQGFKFHFIPRESGYLYIIGPGESNLPTTFLTAQPIAASGVTTNRVEAGADYSFPAGDTRIRLESYGTINTYTIIFSPTPLGQPAFLDSPAYRQLTADEQRELTDLWERFGKQAPNLIQETAGNQPSVAVSLPAGQPGNQPLIFDIPIKRR
jgi:hypothetical protein